MAAPLQLNMRVNGEYHEALERYRYKREKIVRETIPEFRLSLPEAFRMLALGALKREEMENTVSAKETQNP
jgi:hypothetical protein